MTRSSIGKTWLVALVALVSCASPRVDSPQSQRALSEADRRTIFRAAVESEDLAIAETEELYSPTGDYAHAARLVSIDFHAATADLVQDVDWSRARHRQRVLEQFHIDEAQLDAISREGTQHHWPPLDR